MGGHLEDISAHVSLKGVTLRKWGQTTEFRLLFGEHVNTLVVVEKVGRHFRVGCNVWQTIFPSFLLVLSSCGRPKHVQVWRENTCNEMIINVVDMISQCLLVSRDEERERENEWEVHSVLGM